MERRIASRMSLGNWSPVRSRCRCSRFSQACMVCERSSILATFGSDKICLLSSRLLPAANGSYKATSLRQCSKPGSRSAPRTTSTASRSVLAIKKCCNYWSISFVTPKSCWTFVTAIGSFLFSAFFIACLSPACTTPTKSLANCDQVLQLGPFFFPNRSGIKLFGSTNRMHDLVSIWLRRVLISWCIDWSASWAASTRCNCSRSSWMTPTAIPKRWWACSTHMTTRRIECSALKRNCSATMKVCDPFWSNLSHEVIMWVCRKSQGACTKTVTARSERDRRHVSVTQECTCAQAQVCDNTKLELVLVL